MTTEHPLTAGVRRPRVGDSMSTLSIEPLTEIYVSATKIAVPVGEEPIRLAIREINKFVYDPEFPVQLAPYYYSEFLDLDLDNEEYGYIDRHDCFDHDVFADALSDLWTLLAVLSRNGSNGLVQNLTMFLDQFIIAVDCVGEDSHLDL